MSAPEPTSALPPAGPLDLSPAPPATVPDESNGRAFSHPSEFRRGRHDSKIANVGNYVVRVMGPKSGFDAPIRIEHVGQVKVALSRKAAYEMSVVLKRAAAKPKKEVRS